jgi:general secretion pathway protein A
VTEQSQSAKTAIEPSVSLSPILAESFGGMTMHGSRLQVMTLLSEMWQQPPPRLNHLAADLADAEFFTRAGQQIGLTTTAIEDDWVMIQRINLPVIVGLKQPETGKNIFLVLIGWNGRQIRLSGDTPDKIVEIDLDQLQEYQNGPVYVLWKNILGYDEIIGEGSDPKSLLRLKDLLLRIGYEEIVQTPVYDLSLRKSIIDFQSRHQLNADGLVGPLTKILLMKEAGFIDVPLLNQSKEDGV